MCLPEQLSPPNQSLANQRHILQLLAASLLLLAFFAILGHHGFDIFLMLIYAIILYQSWSQFAYYPILIFFLLSTYELILTYIKIIGLVQYRNQISSQDSPIILYTMSKFLYYPAYKAFKHHAQYNSNAFSFGDYELMPTSAPNAPIAQGREQNQQKRGFNAFQGQGTIIG